MPRHDFLRHIVNTKLSEYSKTRRHLIPVLDEVRKLIANAEDQYGFSIYGGKLENNGFTRTRSSIIRRSI